jgi:hypothetical protein
VIRVLVVWCVCYTLVSLVLGLLVLGAAWWEQRATPRTVKPSADIPAREVKLSVDAPAPVRDEFYIEKLFESAGIRGGMVNRE